MRNLRQRRQCIASPTSDRSEPFIDGNHEDGARCGGVEADPTGQSMSHGIAAPRSRWCGDVIGPWRAPNRQMKSASYRTWRPTAQPRPQFRRRRNDTLQRLTSPRRLCHRGARRHPAQFDARRKPAMRDHDFDSPPERMQPTTIIADGIWILRPRPEPGEASADARRTPATRRRLDQDSISRTCRELEWAGPSRPGRLGASRAGTWRAQRSNSASLLRSRRSPPTQRDGTRPSARRRPDHQ